MSKWLGALAGFLPGADQMSEADKLALVRQGLLAAGLGILKNNQGNYGKAGPAIGAGLSEGLLAMNKGADGLADQRYKQQVMDRQLGDPAELRVFRELTKDLSPEDQRKALRVHLGLEGKASSAGYGFDMVNDANGVPRPQRMNPRTGEVEVFVDEKQQWAPLGAIGGQPQAPRPQPQAGDPFAGLLSSVPDLRVTSRNRTAEENARLPNSVPNSYHLSGQAIDIGRPDPQQRQQISQWAAQNGYEVIDNYQDGHVHLEPAPTFKPAPVAGIGRGRKKEEEAAAVRAAERSVDLSALPSELGIRNRASVDLIRAESEIKPTAAQQAVDAAYGKDYVEFLSGGAADANKALSELDGVIRQIRGGANLTGPLLGATPKFLKDRIAPTAAAAQETVESTVQRSLRVILGAQFTEKEGERLIARAYNPSLPEAENLKRVERLFQQLQEGFENKAAAARYYEENGTLRGFTGKLPSWSDFELEQQGNAPQQFNGFRVLD